MKLSTAKRILYGVCGVMCILFTLLSLILQVTSVALAEAMAELFETEVTGMGFSFDTLSFAAAGIFLLILTIGYTRFLSTPSRSKYLFAVTAMAIIVRLVLDLLNKAQGFHAGHVFLLLALAALIHDIIVLQKRGGRLAAINWK